jgi:hypothetical protein
MNLLSSKTSNSFQEINKKSVNNGKYLFYTGLVASILGCVTFVPILFAGVCVMVLGAVVADREASKREVCCL